jgi:hypothetical protein
MKNKSQQTEASEVLNPHSKKYRVSLRAKPPISSSMKHLDREQSIGAKEKALRLFCRALIRLYLKDQGSDTDGNRLGIL